MGGDKMSQTMLKVKQVMPTEPMGPRWAAVGFHGEAVVMRFEKRQNAVEFVEWQNKYEGRG